MSRAERSGLVAAIVKAGLVTGVLDILAAFVSGYLRSQTVPADVSRFIASGVFGKDALTGGSGMAALGLLFHFCIAMTWSVTYFLLYPRIKPIGRYWLAAGLFYGLVVWAVMNRVVLPLSNVPQFPFSLTAAIRGAVILMLMIGLPNAYLARKYYTRQ